MKNYILQIQQIECMITTQLPNNSCEPLKYLFQGHPLDNFTLSIAFKQNSDFLNLILKSNKYVMPLNLFVFIYYLHNSFNEAIIKTYKNLNFIMKLSLNKNLNLTYIKIGLIKY